MRFTNCLFGLFLAFGVQGLGCKSTTYKMVDSAMTRLNGVPFSQPVVEESETTIEPEVYPILETYPGLKGKLKFVPLCDCPTPVQRLYTLEDRLEASNKNLQIHVKNDGMSNREIYGGNKVRKLELLMAHALSSGKKNMLINGTVGSHSAMATAIYAKKLGITPEIHLIPQLPSDRVKANILAFGRVLSLNPKSLKPTQKKNGRITYHSSLSSAFGSMAWQRIRGVSQDKPFICPPGATSVLSTLAYVNAMYELEQDVRTGKLSGPPSRIYVPAGSGGTFIGILIGAKAISMFKDTKIIAVTAGSKRPTGQYAKRLKDVVEYLVQLSDGEFPEIKVSVSELDQILDHSFTGGQYGKITKSSSEAMTQLQKDNLDLEHTYTAKTMARLMADARARTTASDKEIWLYWHTHSVQTALHSLLSSPHVQKSDLEILGEIFTQEELREYDLIPQKKTGLELNGPLHE